MVYDRILGPTIFEVTKNWLPQKGKSGKLDYFLEDIEEFKNLNPTAENIAVVIYDILRPLLQKQYALKVRLYETERNFVEYPVD